MKRSLLLFIVSIVSVHIASGQSSIGIKGGANLAYQKESFGGSDYLPKTVVNLKSLPGYNVGVFYKLKLKNQWTLSGELTFNVIGSRIPYNTFRSGDSSSLGGYYHAPVGYIEVPLLAEYTINRFYIGAGPAFSFRIFNKKLDSVGIMADKLLDVSANVLAGYKITKKLDINVRYSYGLLNIIKEASNINTSLKNRFLNVSLLYSFK